MPKPVDNRQQGARTRHFKSQWADSYARNTKRNVFQGKSVLDTYAAGIINESKDIKEEIFDKDEQLMNDVQSKLDALSKKFGKKEDKQNGE